MKLSRWMSLTLVICNIYINYFQNEMPKDDTYIKTYHRSDTYKENNPLTVLPKRLL